MTDNVTAPAADAVFAADDISGVMYPRGKITLGADATSDGDVCKTNGMPISSNTAANGSGTEQRLKSNAQAELIVDAGGTKINAATIPTGGVGFLGWLSAIWYQLTQTLTVTLSQRTAIGTVTPTVTASAYSAGNCVGGKLTFSSMLDTALSGILQSIHVEAKTAHTAGMKFYLFNADPSSSTFTDKSAPSIAAGDYAKVIGIFQLSQPDNGLGTHAIWVLDAIGKAFAAGGTTLYGVLVTTGTPTPGSTSDFSVTIAVLKD